VLICVERAPKGALFVFLAFHLPAVYAGLVRFPKFRVPAQVLLRPQLASAWLRSWMPRLTRLVSGPYLRLLGYGSMRFSGERAAAALWEGHYEGRLRLVVAFRHNYGMDPQLLGSAVLRGIKLKRGKKLPRTAFVQFVHNFDVGWWAGPLARWAIPRAGGLPVDHAHMTTADLNAIRRAIVEGAQPLAMAPEGGVSYLARSVTRVEPGFARLGFLAAEDLEARGRSEPVVVLPVSFLQEYPAAFSRRFDKALSALEARALGKTAEREQRPRWERVHGLKSALLDKAAAWYAQNYGFCPQESGDRVLALCEHALTLSEALLGLPHDGEFFARFWRVVNVGWERQYIDPAVWKGWTDLEKARANRPNAEAWLAFRHAYFAELGWFLRLEEPTAETSLSALADQLENLGDLVVRLEGANLGGRPVLFTRSVRAIFGTPIDLTARLSQYRQGRKATLAQTMDDLTKQWMDDIKEHDYAG
jgi:hypothetical protein